MKKLLPLIALLFSFNLIAIEDFNGLVIQKKPHELNDYKNLKCIEVAFDYGSAEIKKIKGKLNGDVLFVDYEFSAFARSDFFVQGRLDIERLNNLKTTFPELSGIPKSSWYVVGLPVSSFEEGQKLFHGFKIYYRKRMSKEERLAEIAKLDSIFKDKTGRICTTTITHTRKPEIDPIAKIITDAFFEGPATSYSEGPIITVAYEQMTKDTVFSAVMKRNKDWNDMTILCDVTGSMMPYSAQLFEWFKLNAAGGKVQDFYFFNDGDNMPDHEKEMGKVGGIYHVKTKSFDVMYEVARLAMMNGNGGDGPENNVEALLRADAKSDTSTNYVMIVDNWCTPRDMALADKVKKPVKIIVCGGTAGINVEYINLALTTGGSIHTIEEDITELSKINVGGTITIGKQIFELTASGFILLSTT